MPMFHGMGMMQTAWTVSFELIKFQLFLGADQNYVWQAMSGLVVSAFEPRAPAIVAEPDNVIKASMNTKSDIIFVVPSFIEVSSFFLSCHT